MENLNIDTIKLNESGQDIIALTRELKEEFDMLFTRISNMRTRTLEWVGSSSEQFISRTNVEKIQYNKLISTLNNYGKILVDVSMEYSKVVKK